MRSMTMRGAMRFGWGLLLLPMLLDLRGHAQPTASNTAIWQMVAQEGQSTSVTLPAGTIYRWGTPNCPAGTVANGAAISAAQPEWAQAVALSAATTINPLSMASGTASFGFADPCPNTAKELDVLETVVAQTVTLNGAAVSIPALPAQPIATPGSVHHVVLSNFYDAGGSTQALLLWAVATNQPANGASDTWSGTQFQMTVDGTIMTCLYGQSYTPGTFTLTCTTQALAGQ